MKPLPAPTLPRAVLILFNGADQGRPDAIDKAVGLGAELNGPARFGQQAALRATIAGQPDALERLFLHGVDLVERIRGGEGAFEGATLLWAACFHGQTESAELLIALGADARAANHQGTTCAMAAASQGSSPCLSLLAGAGADFEAKDLDGASALDYVSGRPPTDTPAQRGLTRAFIESQIIKGSTQPADSGEDTGRKPLRM